MCKSRRFLVIKIFTTHLFIICVITVNIATFCCGNRTTSFCCIWHCNRCLQQSLDFTALAELCLLISLIDGVVLVIQEYDFDICRGSSRGSQTVRCLWPITIVFQFKYISIKFSQVLGGWIDFVRRGRIFLCSKWLQVYVNLTLRLIRSTPNKWRLVENDRHDVFDRRCVFSLQASPGDKIFPFLLHPVKAKALFLSNDQYSLWMPSSQCKK